MSTMRQLARCLTREIPHIFSSASRSSFVGSASAAVLNQSTSVSKMAGSAFRADVLTTLQRSIFAAMGNRTACCGPAFAAKIPANFDTSYLDQGIAVVSGSTTTEGGSPVGPSVGEAEDEDEGVLPYKPNKQTKLSRFKDNDDFVDVPKDRHVSVLRRQKQLSSPESSFLWRRAEKLAMDGRLIRVKIGSKGMTPALLSEIESQLSLKELVRVDVLPGSSLDVMYVETFLVSQLDCVVIKTRGSTITLFRDRSLSCAPRHEDLDRSMLATKPVARNQYYDDENEV